MSLRVAVVTAAIARPQPWLEQCHASLRAQAHPCTHIVVTEGSCPLPAGFQGQHIAFEQPHGDSGNTARSAGAASAIAQGFDAVLWLDDDNRVTPDHVASLVELHRTSGAPVCVSGLRLLALDGSDLGPNWRRSYPHHVDANCLALFRPLLSIGLWWSTAPARWHYVADRWLWTNLRRQRHHCEHTGLATVAYRTAWPIDYHRAGRPIPAGTKSLEFARQVEQQVRDLRAHFTAGGS